MIYKTHVSKYRKLLDKYWIYRITVHLNKDCIGDCLVLPYHHHEYAIIDHVEIGKGYRHNGAGKELIEAAERFIITKNLNLIYLPGTEKDARKFWAKLGYQSTNTKIENVHQIYGDNTLDQCYGWHWYKKLRR